VRVFHLLLLLGLPSAVTAQVVAEARTDAVVRCESRDVRKVYCPMGAATDVQLVRQLSEHACIRETGWGVDEQGLWTARGCRAEFVPLTSAVAMRQVRRVIRCESKGRPESCPVTLRGAPVRLLRQLSVFPCKQDTSWGAKRNQVWVSRGCSGEFEVGAADGSGFLDVPRQLTCESKKQQRRECGVSVTRRVTLLRQLSGAACEEGRSWGWNRDGVWVDDGCRAVFSAD
jgi:hypothetical protein